LEAFGRRPKPAALHQRPRQGRRPKPFTKGEAIHRPDVLGTPPRATRPCRDHRTCPEIRRAAGTSRTSSRARSFAGCPGRDRGALKRRRVASRLEFRAQGPVCPRGRPPRGGDARQRPHRTRFARRPAAGWRQSPAGRRAAPGLPGTMRMLHPHHVDRVKAGALAAMRPPPNIQARDPHQNREHATIRLHAPCVAVCAE